MRQVIQHVKFSILKLYLRGMERRGIESLDSILEYDDGCFDGFIEKIINYISIMASNGSHNHCFLLGLCYEFGIGVEQCRKKSVLWYLKSAKQGNSDAQWCVGLFHEGSQSENSKKKAELWYRKSAFQDNIIGLYFLLRYDKSNVVRNKFVMRYRHICSISCGVSGEKIFQQLKITFSYIKTKPLYGILSDFNTYEASFKELLLRIVQCFYRSSKAFITAQKMYFIEKQRYSLFMGSCYEYGWNIGLNYSKAIFWYNRYFKNKDFDKDKYEFSIFRLHRYFAKRNFTYSKYLLSQCYLYGFGTSVNYRGAYFWAKKAALEGDSEGQYLLACLYLEGIGVVKSMKKVRYWAEKSAKQGNNNALFFIQHNYSYLN